MTLYQAEEERTKLRREKTWEAIALATNQRWEKAAAVNRYLIDLFPDDVEAYNRLGKALSELGDYRESANAFQKALELAPNNAIARKNLERLARLKDSPLQPKSAPKVTPHIFIEESGKTALTLLQNPPGQEMLAHLSAGDFIKLQSSGNNLLAYDDQENYIGKVEPRLAARLLQLTAKGNRYEAAITSMGKGEVAIIIREVYRDPSQLAIPSFPSRDLEKHRPPSQESLFKYDFDEVEEEDMERGPKPPWRDDAEVDEPALQMGMEEKEPVESPDELEEELE